MARLPRIILPNQPHHVIQRGNNRQAIFLEKQDYEFYLRKLKFCAIQNDCHIHAYIQMTNHVHLLITPINAASLGKTMQMLGSGYVQYFNEKYQRTGTLLEGRYKASLIDSEQYLFTCMRYIELNAVRAGMVNHPSQYRWSSYHHNALGLFDDLIQAHEKYYALDNTPELCQQYYARLFNESLQEEILDQLRAVANTCRVLGNGEFKQSVSLNLKRQVELGIRGGDRRSKTYQNQRGQSKLIFDH